MLEKEELDREWIQLITKAKQMGYSMDEIRSVLQWIRWQPKNHQ